MTKRIKEMVDSSKEDLENRLDELRRELIKQNSQIATGTTPKSPGQVKETKKTIAKILTILNQKNKMEARKKDE